MFLEETARAAEPFAEIRHAEDFACLLLDVSGSFLPQYFQHLADPAYDVVLVRLGIVQFGVVHEDAVPGDPQGIGLVVDRRPFDRAFRRDGADAGSRTQPFLANNPAGLGGKAVRPQQRSRRTGRQRIERVGIRRRGTDAVRESHVPATVGTADCVQKQCFGMTINVRVGTIAIAVTDFGVSVVR